MAVKSVVIHTCTHADMDSGAPFKCFCAKHTTLKHAKEMVAAGAAAFKLSPLRTAVDYLQILLTGRRLMVPRAEMIEKAHIERAYVYDQESARRRIESYGALATEALVQMGADTRLRTGTSPATHTLPSLPGEGAVLPMWKDLRTARGDTTGTPGVQAVRAVACRNCGFRITETVPRTYPRIFASADRCPDCGSPDGLKYATPGSGES